MQILERAFRSKVSGMIVPAGTLAVGACSSEGSFAPDPDYDGQVDIFAEEVFGMIGATATLRR